jgi:hypothetical protein
MAVKRAKRVVVRALVGLAKNPPPEKTLPKTPSELHD